MPETPVLELHDAAALRGLVEGRPLAVLSDIDGTLSPIVANPEDARATERAVRALAALVERGARVALITGRPLEVAQRMAPVAGAWFAANHGLTTYTDGKAETPADVKPYVELARQAIAEIGEIGLPGVMVEDKGAILALHYRNASSEEDARRAIEAAIARSPAAREFTLHRARKVIELRPPLAINKGTAARDFIALMTPSAVICMGDDATDIDMFRAVKASGVPCAVVAVANNEEAGVLKEADYFVRGVEGVERLLEQILTVMP